MGTMSKGYLTAEVKNILRVESELVRGLESEAALHEMSVSATDSLEQLFRLHFEPTFNEVPNEDTKVLKENLEKALEANASFKEANNDLKESYEAITKLQNFEINWLRSIVEKAVK
jgi:hypothetical protein